MDPKRKRVVGLLCPSFNGTTILSAILDRLPNTFAPGETHWLLEDTQRWHKRCSLCVPPCQVFRPEVLEAICVRHGEGEKWWDLIGELKPQATTIVSSDKHQDYYDLLGLPDVLVIPFRHPLSWACSWILRALHASTNAHEGRIHENARIYNATGFWAQSYETLLRWAVASHLPTIFLNWEVFVTYPVRSLEILCEKTGIEFAPNLAFPTRPTHQLGGNFRMIDGAPQGWVLKRNETWTHVLTDGQIRLAMHNYHHVWRMYKTLLERDILWQLQ